jgi:hypothetical protein
MAKRSLSAGVTATQGALNSMRVIINQRAESDRGGCARMGTIISVVVNSSGIPSVEGSIDTFALPATAPFGSSNSVR